MLFYWKPQVHVNRDVYLYTRIPVHTQVYIEFDKEFKIYTKELWGRKKYSSAFKALCLV